MFAGDGGDANHRLTRFARRYEKRLTLVSRFSAAAALYAPPPRPQKHTQGRPRVKGKKRPSPQDVVKNTKQRKKLTVDWYGGQSRRVEVVTGKGHWDQSSEGLAEVLWVFVHSLTGTHRDEYFFTTNVTHSAKQVIETFTGHWSIEVTFPEVRAHLGVETTRGWIERRVGSNGGLDQTQCYAPSLACSASTRWWRCGLPRCPNATAKIWSPLGPARRQ